LTAALKAIVRAALVNGCELHELAGRQILVLPPPMPAEVVGRNSPSIEQRVRELAAHDADDVRGAKP
jgi:hypothetical protein